MRGEEELSNPFLLILQVHLFRRDCIPVGIYSHIPWLQMKKNFSTSSIFKIQVRKLFHSATCINASVTVSPLQSQLQIVHHFTGRKAELLAFLVPDQITLSGHHHFLPWYLMKNEIISKNFWELPHTFTLTLYIPRSSDHQRLEKYSKLASLAEANAKFCASGGVNQCNKTGWGSNTWEQLFRKKLFRCSQRTSGTSVSRVPCDGKGKLHTELCLQVQSHKVDGSEFWLSTQCLWALRTGQTLTNRTEFQKGLQRWYGHRRMGYGSWVCSVRRDSLGKI